MARPTRILAAIGALLLILLASLLVLPYLFRDRIAGRVKTAVNEKVNARVEWRGASLTFFRIFPNLTLRLDDLTAAGTGRFQGDTLAAIHGLGVVLDLASVLGNLTGGKPVLVRAVELDQPRLSLLKLEDGAANWDIATKPPEAGPAEAKEPARAVAISLQHLGITDAAVAFDNRQAKLSALVKGFDGTLAGDFSRDQVAIRTRADADTVSVTFAGIPYLNRVKLALSADVEADLARKLYTLKQTGLKLNDLTLAVSGSASTSSKNTGLDLAFSAPSTDFRSILSLVPAVYAHDFDKVKTSGKFTVAGKVKGEYGDSAFPSFALDAKVSDAAFQYPDLPLPARDIAMDLSLTNPGGSADSTLVRLDRFHLLLGGNPIDARLELRTPLSDPDVDLRVKGRADLADLRRTVKIEKVDQLTGTVAADAAVRTRMSHIEKKQYERVAASGSVDVGGLTVKGEALPHPLAIQQASLRLAPEHAELRSFSGKVGSSDIQAAGTIDNLLSYMMREDTLRGTATIRSNHFDLDEWRSGEGDLKIIPVPPKLDFGLDATVAELTFDKLKMTDARGRLRLKDQRVTLEDFRMNTLGGQIAVSGFYETTTPAKPTFDVAMKMTKIDVGSAFDAFTTVQMLAPVAKYAVGNVSTEFKLNGALGKNMMPLFPGLGGGGTLQTSQLVIKDFPALEKLVDVTKLQFLDNPTLRAFTAAFQIREGRLFTQPFDVKLGDATMTVSGSNGLDQSLRYTLGLKVPRSLLGGGANEALAGLLSKAGQAGLDVSAAPEIPLAIQVGGSVTTPTVSVDMSSLATSVKQTAEQAVKQAVTEKVDSAKLRLIAEAEQRAAGIRKEAQALADKVKKEGYQRADSLVAKASNPILKAAAEPAAAQIRKQSDEQAARIIREANTRADSVVAAARK